MDYIGKGEVLTNTDLDRFVNNIREKRAFCVHRKSLRSLISAHEKWVQKQKCCVYNFVQYPNSTNIYLDFRRIFNYHVPCTHMLVFVFLCR